MILQLRRHGLLDDAPFSNTLLFLSHDHSDAV
jgi:hypothetical protein